MLKEKDESSSSENEKINGWKKYKKNFGGKLKKNFGGTVSTITIHTIKGVRTPYTVWN